MADSTTVVHVERRPGGLREVHVPHEPPVLFGYHGIVAENYGKKEGDYEPHATALDYVVAALTGCLTGVFGSALDARSIPTGGRLRSTGIGHIGRTDDGVLVVERVEVKYSLEVDKLDERTQKMVDLVMGFHKSKCPVSRTLGDSIKVDTSIEVREAVSA